MGDKFAETVQHATNSVLGQRVHLDDVEGVRKAHFPVHHDVHSRVGQSRCRLDHIRVHRNACAIHVKANTQDAQASSLPKS